MEVFDKDGNLVENVFSQEEVDTKIKEAKEIEDARLKAEADAEAEKNKQPQDPKPDAVMEAIKALQETVGTLVKSTETTGASKYTASLDEEKKTVFNTQFEALQKTGMYDNTPEGIEKRAVAAYTLTTGETPDAGNFNMGNLSAVGGKAPDKSATEMSEADKQISEALGNTAEDFKKYATT